MAKPDTLKNIVAQKKQRLELSKQQVTLEALNEKIAQIPPARNFLEAINKPKQISLIAEIKKASPSAGVIREDFNHLDIARVYQETGVQAVSVLTEEDFFQGSLVYLEEVKNTVQVAVLRKDFIFDPYQVYESRAWGADAVLLIADLLTKDILIQLVQVACQLGMSCLVEVHDEKELKKILNLKVPYPQQAIKVKNAPKLVNFAIGINNRNLHSLEVDFKTTEKLFPLIPKDRVVVVESGIKSRQDIMFLKILGAQAVLIGEAIMRAPNIRAQIEELMSW
ncbi:MAG: indole-3-glycerol phosphate synthase TrpC [Candidatus Omnitrophica bacterium]|jgi:indole-3-glycerol phosphate synthase|nr:indole-3-glycerol phosphate synthase TrpC [Candidatus Omnitrophota bacterium]